MQTLLVSLVSLVNFVRQNLILMLVMSRLTSANLACFTSFFGQLCSPKLEH